jgi:hypothetical protein
MAEKVANVTFAPFGGLHRVAPSGCAVSVAPTGVLSLFGGREEYVAGELPRPEWVQGSSSVVDLTEGGTFTSITDGRDR